MSEPSHRVLLVLIAGIIAVFIMQVLSPDGLSSFEMIPAEVQNAGQAIVDGEGEGGDWFSLLTLLTAALLHADVGHILSNLLFFWMFGGLVGEILGWRWMLTIFVATAIGGSIGDLILRNGSSIPSLGASGAVMGFEGAYLGLAVRWRLPDPYIWPIAHPIPPIRLVILASFGFFLDISGVVSQAAGVAYGAHLGGFLVGLFLTSFIARRPQGI